MVPGKYRSPTRVGLQSTINNDFKTYRYVTIENARA